MGIGWHWRRNKKGFVVHGSRQHFTPRHLLTRMAIAVGMAPPGDVLQASVIAGNLWGPGSIPALALKSAVASGSTSDPDFAALAEYRTAASDFVAMVYPATILGKLNGTRKVPLFDSLPPAAFKRDHWLGRRKSSRAAFRFNVRLDNLRSIQSFWCSRDIQSAVEAFRAERGRCYSE